MTRGGISRCGTKKIWLFARETEFSYPYEGAAGRLPHRLTAPEGH
jgi:hypothetical protein